METDQKKRSRWASWAATALVLLPVLYVLSAGPSAWLVKNQKMFPEWIRFALDGLRAFYKPLVWLINSSDEFERVYRWYLSFWI